MSKKLPRCDSCGRLFRPDRYNKGRQKNCVHPDCVRARKQLRQRKWHADRRAADPDFRTSENARCAKANRLRRAAVKAKAEAAEQASAAAAVERTRMEALSDTVAGLVAQFTDTKDPLQLEKAGRAYADWGRRLSAGRPSPNRFRQDRCHSTFASSRSALHDRMRWTVSGAFSGNAPR